MISYDAFLEKLEETYCLSSLKNNFKFNTLNCKLYELKLDYRAYEIENSIDFSILTLSANEDFLTYTETKDYKAIIGYQNIFNFFKNEILNYITQKLNIEISDINNDSLKFLKMYTY